ncbi:dTDP-4-dehydrorhamnose 3,5-epimerase [Limisphaera sp. VF-2]|jgi:dTDP-4-dehydrorhamnose 3,5-epimerase|uniref:dTDP-4-dehydrorhamnose 3,5-epimerase n=1 Tax=Limisphaera sp. VF-2 TaxID=3400418 RepID=UPI00175F906C
MNVIPCELEGVLLIEPRVYGDARGYFLETWNERRYREAGIPGPFVQDNLSFSRRGAVRGLHFQNPSAQAKLVYVLEGEVFDVAVDLRRRSPTFGRWFGVRLSAENKRQLYIPVGFAHGFAVLSETALFAYKCTEFYAPEHEVTLLWNDPDLGIPWPVDQPVLSDKDQRGRRLRDLPPEKLFP